MWDHNNTPPFEEPTSSLVTVGTPLWGPSHHSELVGHGYVGHGWHPSFFGSKPPLHRPPLRVLEPRKVGLALIPNDMIFQDEEKEITIQ
ncbi:hypothetical protein Tco_0516178 [Tanacetum coccineum]